MLATVWSTILSDGSIIVHSSLFWILFIIVFATGFIIAVADAGHFESR